MKLNQICEKVEFLTEIISLSSETNRNKTTPESMNEMWARRENFKSGAGDVSRQKDKESIWCHACIPKLYSRKLEPIFLTLS